MTVLAEAAAAAALQRKKEEELYQAQHEEAIKNRRSSFESRFMNVWSYGPTGVSMM